MKKPIKPPLKQRLKKKIQAFVERASGRKTEIIPFLTKVSDDPLEGQMFIAGKPIFSEGKIVNGSHGYLKLTNKYLEEFGDFGLEVYHDVPLNYRGKGIGTAMLEEAERIAREKGAAFLYAETTSHNLAAIKTYKKMGWRFLRKKSEKLGATMENSVFYCKPLKPLAQHVR